MASQNDSRIIPIGKVIRATRLDELPQLFNIFRGKRDIIDTIKKKPYFMGFVGD